MRLTLHFWTLILMFHFIPRIFALPSSTSTTSRTLTRHVTSTSTSTPLVVYTYRPPIVQPTRSHYRPLGTDQRPPGPAHTRGPDNPNRRRGQTPIVIFFEVLCGVIAVALFFGALRFCRSYRKTPNRDRILNVINRHRLQLELEELQRRPPTRRFSIQEPAPPYIPPPPSYDGPPPIQQSRDIHYAEIPSSSPPDSPVISRHSLQEVDTPDSPPNNVLPNR